jgi:pimeloyl-ACP methyl ester carboxylesterase
VFGELGEHLSIYAPDLPGFGASEMPAAATDTEFFIRFLRGFVDRLGIQRPILMGLSLGGMICTGYSLRHPESCEALVLAGAAGLSRKMRWRWTANVIGRLPYVYRSLTRITGSNRRLLRRALRLHLHRPPPEELVAQVQRAIRVKDAGAAWRSFLSSEVGFGGFRTCYEDELEQIETPTLFVHGSRDRMVPVEHSRKAHQRVHNSELKVFEGCGHWVPRELPGEFSRVALRFLESRAGQ